MMRGLYIYSESHVCDILVQFRRKKKQMVNQNDAGLFQKAEGFLPNFARAF